MICFDIGDLRLSLNTVLSAWEEIQWDKAWLTLSSLNVPPFEQLEPQNSHRDRE